MIEGSENLLTDDLSNHLWASSNRVNFLLSFNIRCLIKPP